MLGLVMSYHEYIRYTGNPRDNFSCCLNWKTNSFVVVAEKTIEK